MKHVYGIILEQTEHISLISFNEVELFESIGEATQNFFDHLSLQMELHEIDFNDIYDLTHYTIEYFEDEGLCCFSFYSTDQFVDFLFTLYIKRFKLRECQ